MRIYMVRHGETELNARGCYYGRTDVSLTEKGKAQADGLKRGLLEVKFDYVFVSPLRRAIETADRILSGRELEMTMAEELSEQDFGIFEGLTYKELTEKYSKELDAWNQDYYHYQIPEGESFLMVRNRIDQFLKTLSEPVDGKKIGREENVLIVAHKGTLGHMMASLLGLPLEGYWNFVFEQGCYNRVDLEDGYAIIRKLNQSI